MISNVVKPVSQDLEIRNPLAIVSRPKVLRNGAQAEARILRTLARWHFLTYLTKTLYTIWYSFVALPLYTSTGGGYKISKYISCDLKLHSLTCLLRELTFLQSLNWVVIIIQLRPLLLDRCPWLGSSKPMIQLEITASASTIPNPYAP
jgi:hypothetical protein